MNSEIIKVNTADTKKYSNNNRQTLKQKEQIKLRRKEKKRNGRAGKKATVNNSDSRRESEEEEEEASEEESPRKIEPIESHRIRTARLNYSQPTYRDLNEQISNMKEDEKNDLAVRFRA